MPLASKQKIYSPKQLQQHNFNLGKLGEDHALDFLLQRGFLMIIENFQGQSGAEIDLICLDERDPQDKILVFVEVKTRQSRDFGWVGKSATQKGKLHHAQTAANEFRHRFRRQYGRFSFRFDVVTVYIAEQKQAPPIIEHIENVTWLNHGFRL